MKILHRLHLFRPVLSLLVPCFVTVFSVGVTAAGLTHFTPQGEALHVTQVTAQFDAPVRPLGDIAGPAPLEFSCSGAQGIAGKTRWVDVRTWAVDFSPDLPAGVRCEFRPVAGLKDAAGQPLTMAAVYHFNTGGPWATQVTTLGYGDRHIDEEAVFVVHTAGDVDFASIEPKAWCVAEGIGESIPVKLVGVAEQKKLADAARRSDLQPGPRTVLLRCARRLPNGARVKLFWGAGIKGSSGLLTTRQSSHEFQVRPEFSVQVTCPRENARAACHPLASIPLDFTAPLMRADAEKLRLVGPKGQEWAPELLGYPEGGEAEAEAETVDRVEFKGPFPAEAEFRLKLPTQLRDDAGRPLANRERLAAVVLKTADYPPLLKFSADFGIVEFKTGGLLPVTLRNLDVLAADGLPGLKTPDGTPPGTAARLRVRRVTRDEDVIALFGRLSDYADGKPEARAQSVLQGDEDAKIWLLPKPHGPKPMEVVGIPLGEPGYYVVEAESARLGRSLLETGAPMFVHSAALNTNLAVHFKQGAENQLVWVTTLDTGKPVADASISLRDCRGTQIAFGKTGADGTMAVRRRLPEPPRTCQRGLYGYYVSARATLDGIEDFSFVLSTWQEGIESWRFQLPWGYAVLPDVLTHTVFDRPLFRVGETVHMKHIARRHTTAGYGWAPRAQLPEKMVIQLENSDTRYELPLSWKGGSAESDWTVPAGAKLGRYWVSFVRGGARGENEGRFYGSEGDDEAGGDEWWPSSRFWRGGSFRVGEFRLPVLKGEVAHSRPALTGDRAEVSLKLNYLAGGAASGEKVRVRSELTPLYASQSGQPEHLEGYSFNTQPVDAGRMGNGGWQSDQPAAVVFDDQRDVTLDSGGTRRVSVRHIPAWKVAGWLRTEMEYADPSGEIHTASAAVRWLPAAVQAGIAAEGSWRGVKPGEEGGAGKVRVAIVDADWKPRADSAYRVMAWQIRTMVHRKRLIGGLYSYDTQYVSVPLGEVCAGRSDARGLAECAIRLPGRERGVSSMEVVFEVLARDAGGRQSQAATSLWLSPDDGGEWGEDRWFEQGDSDRIDVTPGKKNYEPGETARFTVKMPFRQATALVSVEREGIIDRFVMPLSGSDPVFDLPVKANYGPNVYVSVLVVRGRVGDVQPTALVDLGKPAYKLGIAEIGVGRKGYELKVAVEPAQAIYRTREEASVRVRVMRPDGTPARGGEFALAAVDDALLELAPNKSWELLTRFMARRGYAVSTSTAQSQVIGKRHFGLKAVPAGGGGGRQPTRELFDTLIKWQARVMLDDNGEAIVKLPLNDSLTRIRVVAVAQQGAALFGTGMATFNTTRDVQLFSGLPPVVRDADRFRAGFTVRNLTGAAAGFSVDASVSAQVGGRMLPLPGLPRQMIRLAAGEGREVAWNVDVPDAATRLDWRVEARASGVQETAAGASDALKVSQKVLPGTPVRVLAATLAQLDGSMSLPVLRPKEALPGRGSIEVALKSTLGAANTGVYDWMEAYPYMCLEQQLSRALATGNLPRWEKVQSVMGAYLDNNGLAAYFRNPRPNSGSPVLTAYILTAAQLSGYPLPGEVREPMLQGLQRYIEGRIAFDEREWSPREDRPIRKLKVLEALARYQRATPQLLSTVSITPGVWPVGGVVSWLAILQLMPDLPDRAVLLAEAEAQIRARLVRSGTLTQFVRERDDYWWWLMDSPDGTAARTIVTLMEMPGWRAEIPRLVRGVLARQQAGHWDTTTANAWGVIMMERFRQQFEAQKVAGLTEVSVAPGGATALVAGAAVRQKFDWASLPAQAVLQEAAQAAGRQAVPPAGSAWRDAGSRLSFAWPASTLAGESRAQLALQHQGSGKPWVTVQARAALPLAAPRYAGFEVKKEILPVERRKKESWSKGDVVEVRLTLSAPTPWTWVVVDDPVPAGATILGTGLGRESSLAMSKPTGQWSGLSWNQPAYVERTFDAYRAYYEYFRGTPDQPVKIVYRLRLNNAGEFVLPPTHVEAMYAPENFGEIPNAAWPVSE